MFGLKLTDLNMVDLIGHSSNFNSSSHADHSTYPASSLKAVSMTTVAVADDNHDDDDDGVEARIYFKPEIRGFLTELLLIFGGRVSGM